MDLSEDKMDNIHMFANTIDVNDIMDVYPLTKRINRGGSAEIFEIASMPDRLFRIQKLPEHSADLDLEIEIAHIMTNRNISPVTFLNFVDSDFHGMLIERYQMDLHKYLQKTPEPDPFWISNVAYFVKKLIREGIICLDIKPGNIVVNLANHNIRDLRLIDFGGDWCSRFSEFWQPGFVLMLLLIEAHLKIGNASIAHLDGAMFGSRINRMMVNRKISYFVLKVLDADFGTETEFENDSDTEIYDNLKFYFLQIWNSYFAGYDALEFLRSIM
jgi:hypothetical protein